VTKSTGHKSDGIDMTPEDMRAIVLVPVIKARTADEAAESLSAR